ncbi:MAG TPA: thioredoxin domain-containing protein, partial [Vicinamibacteria bacterium]|nr:thioredoxin domain-containing protein [Vicinamibacteria bacterium]
MANRLARESSPYLLLHKDNPVDWYPWGEEAFARARAEDKPIFLSVGYSTCYWCHVMERETFSSSEIAREMNDGFVCVKVDREERPDVDETYMAATQLMARSGGWPNSVFLTPDLKPFFAGTYFPPADGRGRPGFSRVLQSLREAWLFRRAELLQQAEMVAEAMGQHLVPPRGTAEALPGPDLGDALLADLAARFDPEWGGFGPAPKFPSPANLFFLLERAASEEAHGMLVTTLDRMSRGGLMDQLAGGFHRYSTDEAWLVPHFEKMLYDNASLAWLYAEASALAPGLGFERVARLTLDFVLREMTGPEGGFLSAIDAETQGHEGAYYTWTAAELDAALPGQEGALFRAVYGLEGPPPFEGERYVLYLHAPLAEQARAGGLSEAELLRRLEPGRRALLEARSGRERPLTDDKVLADWNGLMIGAMARAGARLAEPRYLAAAERAAGFALSRLAGDGTLLHVFRDGRARIPAFLDDYAFLVEGLLQLHGATGEKRWLAEAVRLAEEQERRLGDGPNGGCFGAGEDPRLLFRAKPAFDAAVASGNGVAALNAVELARLTGEPSWAGRAEAALLAFADGMARAPLAPVTLGRALQRL